MNAVSSGLYSTERSSEDERTKLSMEGEGEDQRREAAIASTPCLQPNFNSRGLTKEQLAKFRVLYYFACNSIIHGFSFFGYFVIWVFEYVNISEFPILNLFFGVLWPWNANREAREGKNILRYLFLD